MSVGMGLPADLQRGAGLGLGVGGDGGDGAPHHDHDHDDDDDVTDLLPPRTTRSRSSAFNDVDEDRWGPQLQQAAPTRANARSPHAVDLPFLDSMRGEFNPGAQSKRRQSLESDNGQDNDMPLADVDAKYALLHGDQHRNMVKMSNFDRLTADKVDALLGNNNTSEFWLDICKANEDDLETLRQKQGIHSVTLGDILGADNRERVEFFESYMLVCVQMTSPSDPVNEGPFLTMLIFPNCIFSFHDEPAPIVRQVMERMCSGTILLTPDRVMYLMLGEALKVWIPVVHAAEDEVESLHDLALVLSDSDKNDTLLRMATSRRLITGIQRKLLAKRDVFRAVTVGAFPFVRTETQPYLRDALDHLMDLLRIVNVARDALNQLQANYLAKVSLDLADSAQKTNIAMKVFSLVATIGLPINAISGILGMNVWYPGRVEVDESGIPFLFTILLMLSIGLVMFVLFRWNKLL